MKRFLPLLALVATPLFAGSETTYRSDGSFLRDITTPSNWQIDIGGGLQIAPTYLGDDDYVVNLLPALRISYGDRFAISQVDGATFELFKTENFTAGPIARYDFGREEDGEQLFQIFGDETDDLEGLGDIDDTIEMGFFAAYQTGPWQVRAEALKGLSGGHEGLVSRVSTAYTIPVTPFGYRSFLTTTADLRFGDSDWTDTFFGITPNQSADSGLSRFDADGGVTSYGLRTSLITKLSERYTLISTLGYQRLGGDVADSPLVEERGSENQFSAGVFLTYSF